MYEVELPNETELHDSNMKFIKLRLNQSGLNANELGQDETLQASERIFLSLSQYYQDCESNMHPPP